MPKKETIDLGKFVINEEKDAEKLARYLQALEEGDETYKPEGLDKMKKTAVKEEIKGIGDEYKEYYAQQIKDHIDFMNDQKGAK